MKGLKRTRWYCDLCDMTLDTYKEFVEVPLHLCEPKISNTRETNIQPMKKETNE
jgi:hypothetical protein